MHGVDHVGGDAELYALGALDELETARVERHVRECAACARRVGEAEETVLRLIEPEPGVAHGRAPRFGSHGAPAGWIAAVAAAFLIGLLPWGVSRLHPANASSQAETAMLAGHFAHAPFVARAPGAPQGKAIYALRGGWLYVIVAPGRDALDVALVGGGTRRVVASIAASSQTRSAFVRTAGSVDAVELLDRGRPVSSAPIAQAPPARR